MSKIALFLSLLLPLVVQADLSGRVVAVADGDTITVLDAAKRQIKIRLHQIDAPEKKQDFGQASKQSLSDLVFGKEVRIEVADTDKYGRTVGKVWIGGTDANLEQVKRGMAWVYEKYANEPAYFAAERTAKMNRVGLWNQPNPMPLQGDEQLRRGALLPERVRGEGLGWGWRWASVRGFVPMTDALSIVAW